MITACEAQTLAISSTATAQATASPPLPPCASGMAMPMRPSSPMRRTVSLGKRASRSMAAAIGPTSLSANSRATAWIIRCSSLSSTSISQGALDGALLLFLQELLELRREQRGDLEQVSHDPVVGDLEDRRLRVLVDRADHLRGPHPGQVLDGPGDPEPHVELRRDRAAR